jgi:beta-glucanase (GH16 family)
MFQLEIVFIKSGLTTYSTMKNFLSEICFFLFISGITSSCIDYVDTTQGPPKDRKWNMVWHDEFDGTVLDTNLWFRISHNWEYPGMISRHSDDNLVIDGNGKLINKLTKDDQNTVLFNRGIVAKYKKSYGYFEARVQFSTQPGWWSAFWLSGYPYNEGDDSFTYPQEFDIYEDFYKPKKENDIQQCYHANAGLPVSIKAGEFGMADMINCKVISRHSLPKKFILSKYEGWHTVALEWTPLEHIFYIDGKESFRMTYRQCPVTTVPEKIWISGCFPKTIDTTLFTFYGKFHKAKLPDQFMVDYVRVYDEDWGNKTAPIVTVRTVNSKPSFSEGESVEFQVNAKDNDGVVKILYIFSKGRIRDEENVDSGNIEHLFKVTNLFAGENTIIAMAKDNDGRVGLSEIIHVFIQK